MESLEALKALDREVDMYVQSAMKIKDREVRRELMDKVSECKTKVVQVLEVLRTATNGQLGNATIAQLNDCAYKAIRKQGQQKKLDERAIKNEQLFKAND